MDMVKVQVVADDMGSDWNYTWNDLGPRFTCSEAETLAELLRAIGKPDQADSLIDGHAPGDDDGDMHAVCRHCDRPMEREDEDQDLWSHVDLPTYPPKVCPTPESALTIRQTACRHCGLDIEGTVGEADWRDRGNNTTCPTPKNTGRQHEPVDD